MQDSKHKTIKKEGWAPHLEEKAQKFYHAIAFDIRSYLPVE